MGGREKMAKRILVLDDEPGFRDVMKDVLAEHGYEVEATPYIASAVSQAVRRNYDLITLDLRIPGLDGVEIAQLFSRTGVQTPVLVISGYLDDSVTQELKANGISHFLDKPTDIPDLLSAVEGAIAA
jgi:CheY-like chemotaxis protein